MHIALRRTATGLGVGALAFSALALTPGTAHAALPLSSAANAVSATAPTSTTTSLKYDCSTTKGGFKIGLGTWGATLGIVAPLTAAKKSTLTATSLTAAITIPSSTTSLLRLVGVSSLSGTANVAYTASGAVATPGARSTVVNLATVKVPASGSFAASLSGGPITETTSASAGTATFTIGGLAGTLKTNSGKSLPITCTPSAGQSLVVLKVTVK